MRSAAPSGLRSPRLRLPALLTLALALLTAVSTSAWAPVARAGRPEAPPAPGRTRLLVKFKLGAPPVSAAGLKAAAGARESAGLPALGVKVLELPTEAAARRAEKLYRRHRAVEYAELDVPVEAQFVPNDTYYSSQTTHRKVDAAGGWDVTRGEARAIVAVLDTGIDGRHAEFSGRLVAGWDFVNSDADPTDDKGHGTACAGIIGATGNNARGIAGMGWNTRIMPVKVLDSTGRGWSSNLAKGIVYAADHGARVINLSLGGFGYSTTTADAVAYARSKGVVLVASAGNDGASMNSYYPAAYPGVIGVAALNGDTKASFSNWGPYVDVAAPGVSVYTTKMGGTYGYFTGTSASAPYVAGLASLAVSRDPSVTPAAVESFLTRTARDLGAVGKDQYYGAGCIQAGAALRAVAAAAAPDVAPPAVAVASPAGGSTVSGKVAFTVSAVDDRAVARVDFLIDGVVRFSDTTPPYAATWDTYGWVGTRRIAARASDTSGNQATSPAVTVNVVKARPAW